MRVVPECIVQVSAVPTCVVLLTSVILVYVVLVSVVLVCIVQVSVPNEHAFQSNFFKYRIAYRIV